MKKWKWDRIISVATLASSLIAIVLVLKKPHPVAQPMPAAVAAAKAESFQQKVEQFEQPKQPGQAPAEVHLSSEEISAAFAQAAGAIPMARRSPGSAVCSIRRQPTQHSAGLRGRSHCPGTARSEGLSGQLRR